MLKFRMLAIGAMLAALPTVADAQILLDKQGAITTSDRHDYGDYTDEYFLDLKPGANVDVKLVNQGSFQGVLYLTDTADIPKGVMMPTTARQSGFHIYSSPGARYKLVVRGIEGSMGSYRLTATTVQPPAPLKAGRVILNETGEITMRAWNVQKDSSGNKVYGDIWFVEEVPPGSNFVVTAVGQGDLQPVVTIFDRAGDKIDTPAIGSKTSIMHFTNADGDIYQIRVAGRNGSLGRYRVTVLAEGPQAAASGPAKTATNTP